MSEGSRDLDQWVCVATSVYYNKDLEKEKKGPGKGKEKGLTEGSSDRSTPRGSPGAQSKPKDMFSM
jgi:hypothetical protein